MQIELATGHRIGDGAPCFTIAEIGQNHNGDVYTAVRIMKAAADAGVDAVKLCKRDIASELTREAYQRPYEGPHSYGPTYGAHREALELTADEYKHLADRVRYNEWPFVLFATACDQRSVDDVMAALNPPLWKVASRDLTNLPLLDYIGQTGRPVILSAGMAQDGEIDDALDTVRRHHNNIVLCVCTSEYPTPNHHVGLRRIKWWRARYDVLVGLSDHTAGITAAIAATALGACLVEKHVTLSRAMRGTDHAASLEPAGLSRMVAKIREVEAMLQAVVPPYCMQAARAKLARSLTSGRTIQQGEVITEDVLCLKSPGTGLAWRERDKIVGMVAARTVPADTTLSLADVTEYACVSG